MTEEERIHYGKIRDEQRKRYETNLKIGGISETGNYCALSNRRENEERIRAENRGEIEYD